MALAKRAADETESPHVQAHARIDKVNAEIRLARIRIRSFIGVPRLAYSQFDPQRGSFPRYISPLAIRDSDPTMAGRVPKPAAGMGKPGYPFCQNPNSYPCSLRPGRSP